VAAAFAKELLEYVQPSDVDGERTAKDILSEGQLFTSSSSCTEPPDNILC
jgi:hypothetical protein